MFPSLWHFSETLCHSYNGQFKIYDALHNLLPHFRLAFFFFKLTEEMNILRLFQIQDFKVILSLSLWPDSPSPLIFLSKIENFRTSQCLWRDWIYVWLTFKIKCYCRKCQSVEVKSSVRGLNILYNLVIFIRFKRFILSQINDVIHKLEFSLGVNNSHWGKEIER